MRRIVLATAVLMGCASAPSHPEASPRTPTIVSPEGTTAVRTSLPVPSAENALDGEPADGPLVEVIGTTVKFDGRDVDDVRPLLERRRLARLEALFEALRDVRRRWKEAHPDARFPGRVNLAFGPDTSMYVVKSIFQTAAFAGYPHVRMLVRTPRGPGWLVVDAQVPGLPGAVALEPRDPGAPGPPTRAIGEQIAPQEIHRIVRTNFGKFRTCYEAGLARDPELRGKVLVRFVIEADGRVRVPAEDAGSTLTAPEVIACMLRAYESMVFPPPTGGTVSVVYPVDFDPG
jgi:hypothetical protein